MVLDASIPNGFAPLTGSLKVDPVGDASITGDGKLAWRMQAERSVAKLNNPLDLISKVLGKTPAMAAKNLSKLETASPPQVTISPSWWPWMPFLPMRILVETQQ
jgi:hypothetical protein